MPQAHKKTNKSTISGAPRDTPDGRSTRGVLPHHGVKYRVRDKCSDIVWHTVKGMVSVKIRVRIRVRVGTRIRTGI